MDEKLDKINMKIDMINKIDGKMDGMIERVKRKIYMIYGEVYVLGEINEDEVCKRMSVLNKIEDKIDEIVNLIKMEMCEINEEMDRELDEKMNEETNNEIDELVNLMNVKIDEEMGDGDVCEKTNRINKKIDVVNKMDE